MVVSLHMGWRHVLFANWPVEPEIIEPHLPDLLTLETYDGMAWITMTPFTNIDVRPRVLPSGFGQRVPELNLRTYVTHNGDPAVYFFSLDADGRLAVLGARVFHQLPYYYANIDLLETANEIRFTSARNHPGARPAHVSVTYEPRGSRFYAEEESLEYFLTERYRYYTESATGELRYATITHEPWPLYDTGVAFTDNTLFAANGFPSPSAEPVCFYSPGVDTIASPSKLVTQQREVRHASPSVSTEFGEDPILLFDGVCNLCNGIVQFIAPRDTKGRIRFASLQSETGKQILGQCGLPTDQRETIVFVEKDQCYVKSDAVFQVVNYLDPPYPALSLFRNVPRSFRDRLYDLVADHRYQWFGQKDECMIPTGDIKSRFIE